VVPSSLVRCIRRRRRRRRRRNFTCRGDLKLHFLALNLMSNFRVRGKTLADRNDVKVNNILGPSAAIASFGEFNVKL
jgi:hypothetical protein